MRVHPDLGDHQRELTLGVALQHGFAHRAVHLPIPDVRDAIGLGLHGTWELGNGHVEEDLVDGGFLGKRLLVLIVAVLEDLLE